MSDEYIKFARKQFDRKPKPDPSDLVDAMAAIRADAAAKERKKAAALVSAWFHEMRWSGNHLGLGDVRVTIAQADELADAIERGEHTEAPDAM